MSHVDIMVIAPRRCIVKHKDSYLEGKGGGIIILVLLHVDSYQTLKPWHDYIYMKALRCNQHSDNKN
jgi:hypothetical protein